VLGIEPIDLRRSAVGGTSDVDGCGHVITPWVLASLSGRR
jgi:hypothetical protein